MPRDPVISSGVIGTTFLTGFRRVCVETVGDQCSSAEAEEMYWAVRTVNMNACKD